MLRREPAQHLFRSCRDADPRDQGRRPGRRCGPGHRPAQKKPIFLGL